MDIRLHRVTLIECPRQLPNHVIPSPVFVLERAPKPFVVLASSKPGAQNHLFVSRLKPSVRLGADARFQHGHSALDALFQVSSWSAYSRLGVTRGVCWRVAILFFSSARRTRAHRYRHLSTFASGKSKTRLAWQTLVTCSLSLVSFMKYGTRLIHDCDACIDQHICQCVLPLCKE
jgi:hypothetical protein